MIHMSRYCIEIAFQFIGPITNAFQTFRQGPDSKVICHCDDVPNHCQLLFKTFIMDLLFQDVTLAWHSYSQNQNQDLFDAEVCEIQYPIYGALILSLLSAWASW